MAGTQACSGRQPANGLRWQARCRRQRGGSNPASSQRSVRYRNSSAPHGVAWHADAPASAHLHCEAVHSRLPQLCQGEGDSTGGGLLNAGGERTTLEGGNVILGCVGHRREGKGCTAGAAHGLGDDWRRGHPCSWAAWHHRIFICHVPCRAKCGYALPQRRTDGEGHGSRVLAASIGLVGRLDHLGASGWERERVEAAWLQPPRSLGQTAAPLPKQTSCPCLTRL